MPSIDTDLRCNYRHLGSPRKAELRGLSESGVFLSTTDKAEKGLKVPLAIELGRGGRVIKCGAVVRWSTEGDTAEPAGWGLDFIQVSEEDRFALIAFLAGRSSSPRSSGALVADDDKKKKIALAVVGALLLLVLLSLLL